MTFVRSSWTTALNNSELKQRLETNRGQSFHEDYLYYINLEETKFWQHINSKFLIFYTLKLLAETCVQRRCESDILASVALRYMVGFVKLFRTSVARQVSGKVEPLSTSATTRNGRSGEKTRISPCNTTSWNFSFAALLHISFLSSSRTKVGSSRT